MDTAMIERVFLERIEVQVLSMQQFAIIRYTSSPMF